MTELKTLENLENGETIPIKLKDCISKNNLKQEAIKWIKAIDNPVINGEDWSAVELPGDNRLNSNYDENDMNGAIIVLMSFFNIKEEDLK